MPNKKQATKGRKAKRAKAANALKAVAAAPKNKPVSIGSAIGSKIGSKLGLGSTIGGALGNLAQNAFSSIFGKGDYTGFEVEKNSLVVPRHADTVPLFGTEDGVIRVRHREYLRDVIGSTLFHVDGFPIIPNNADVFPWLAPMAELFEQYRIMGMIFEFKSIATTAVLNQVAMGSIFMATQYNAYMPGFTSKRQILNHYFGTSAAIRDTIIHPIECKEMYDPFKCYYTRPTEGGPGPGRDVRLEDFGNFYIGSQGVPTGISTDNTIGELWVSYDIVFFKPRIKSGNATVFVFDPPPPGPEDNISVVHIPFGGGCPCPETEEKHPG